MGDGAVTFTEDDFRDAARKVTLSTSGPEDWFWALRMMAYHLGVSLAEPADEDDDADG